MDKIIIGLVGRKQAGKDTVADFLVEELGYTRVAFADTLRQMAYDINPVVSVDPLLYYADVIDSIGYEAGKATYEEFRRFLQRLGTNGIRKVDPDFWINQAYKRIQEIPGDVVITDVRFYNEVGTVERLGGVTARVHRPGVSDIPAEHESESELDEYRANYVLMNDATIEALQAQAMSLHAAVLLDKVQEDEQP